MIKFWLTRGRGGLGISDSECIQPGFYALATSETLSEIDRIKGWRVTSSPVEPKSEYFASIKSNNYLQNVLAQMEAEARGFDTVGCTTAGSPYASA